MIVYKSGTGLWFGIALLTSTISGAGDCHIERDTQSCPQVSGTNYFKNELKCLMQQNDLKTIMECVKKDNGANIEDEVQICRDPATGDSDSDNDEEEEDDGFEFFDFEYFNDEFYNYGEQICLKARTIMIKGPLAVDGAAALIGISGTITSCPYGNVNFHKCLCATGVGRNSIVKLSAYFKNGLAPDLTCTQSSQKRTDFLDDIMHKPHMHQARDNTWGGYVHNSSWLISFTIDDYGRPIYLSGSIGDRLPYFDQWVRDPAYDHLGTLARRCYVHPDVNDIAECRTWVVTSTSVPASEYSLSPVSATYRKTFTRTDEITSLRTVEPGKTDVPVAMPMLVNSTITSRALKTTPARTGAEGPEGPEETGAASRIFGSGSFGLLAFAVSLTL